MLFTIGLLLEGGCEGTSCRRALAINFAERVPPCLAGSLDVKGGINCIVVPCLSYILQNRHTSEVAGSRGCEEVVEGHGVLCPDAGMHLAGLSLVAVVRTCSDSNRRLAGTAAECCEVSVPHSLR